MSIQASFPPEKRVYNINLILDLQTRNVKWESQQGPNLTLDQFDNVLTSSILELKLANGQKIPNSKIVTEFEHFYLDVTSQMFNDQRNYSIFYDTDTNSATFTIMPRTGNYNIYGYPVDSKGGNGRGGRPRRRSTFRQRRLKRTAAKSRRATRRTRRRV